ncbi:hypothetical protein B0H34DRAFT_827968 [Crassisporium funariophilum]|nr:hypothetical protein B0H34DRAFT_827968 [Crassisporium funariophilum]
MSQGQRVLEHVGAHILKDPGIDRSVELCGLCLRPSPLCQFYIGKGKGSKGKPKVNYALTRGCIMNVKFTYKIAATSLPASPCSNVPIQCPTHFEQNHRQLMSRYEDLWTLSNFESSEMGKIWAKRATVLIKRTRKSKLPPLVISEDHRAQIASFDSQGGNDDLDNLELELDNSEGGNSESESDAAGKIKDMEEDKDEVSVDIEGGEQRNNPPGNSVPPILEGSCANSDANEAMVVEANMLQLGRNHLITEINKQAALMN